MKDNTLKTASFLSGFGTKKVMVVGDLMLDRFIWGKVDRVSPEAPVPVVCVDRESTYPGGAANVGRNIIPFADEVRMVGRIGTDPAGVQLKSVLEDSGANIRGVIESAAYQTISKTRIVAQQQQLVRLDRERIEPASDAEVEMLMEFVESALSDTDAIIIEDYGKGLVTQKLVDRLVAAAINAGVIVTVDPNPGNPLAWKGVTAVKPNRREAFLEAGYSPALDASPDPLTDDTLLAAGQRLLEKWECQLIPVTLGDLGMMLFQRDHDPHHIPTRAQAVFDVSGAGDTAIALFTLALAAGASPREATELANYASGVVVGKLGTATLTPEELIVAVATHENSERQVSR